MFTAIRNLLLFLLATTNEAAASVLRSRRQLQSVVGSAELAQHGTSSDCWVAFVGKVYAMTTYGSQHPGGSSLIYDRCGTDGTADFQAVHPDSYLDMFVSTTLIGDYEPNAVAPSTLIDSPAPVVAPFAPPIDSPVSTPIPSTPTPPVPESAAPVTQPAISPASVPTPEPLGAIPPTNSPSSVLVVPTQGPVLAPIAQPVMSPVLTTTKEPLIAIPPTESPISAPATPTAPSASLPTRSPVTYIITSNHHFTPPMPIPPTPPSPPTPRTRAPAIYFINSGTRINAPTQVPTKEPTKSPTKSSTTNIINLFDFIGGKSSHQHDEQRQQQQQQQPHKSLLDQLFHKGV